MPKLSLLVTTLVLLMFAIAADGQTPASTANAGRTDGTNSGSAVADSKDLASRARITPFSADEIEVSDGIGANGRHPHYETYWKLFRDSQGRMRQERLPGVAGPARIAIFDPRTRLSLELYPASRTATINRLPMGVTLTDLSPPATTRHEPPATQRTEAAPLDAPVNDGPHVGTVTKDANNNMLMGPVQPDQLGPTDMEGFTVTGERKTWIIPAGEFGNDKQESTSIEIWYSPDLQMRLMEKTKGPHGTVEHKLVNIRIVDPDPLLFEMPAGYKVTDHTK